MKIRHEFVLRALAKEQPLAEVCREFGISRKTAYKWIERFNQRGLSGLIDESRRPKTFPTQISADVTLAIIQLRREHQRWGPKKIHAVLRRQFATERVPSQGSIARILHEAGLAHPGRRMRKVSGGPPARPPRLDAREPNDVWTVDFKGWWRVRNGAKVEPLTVRDAASRYVLAVRIVPSTKTTEVRPVFEELFQRYGLPKTIQSDNGPPFASYRAIAGLTKLSAWWVSLGINVVRSRPACPQDNGAHERMHADMRIDLQANAAATVEAQQAACDDWVTVFNHVRPHEALQMRTPGELYRPSSRRFATHVIGGFPEGCELFEVKGREVKWRATKIHIGEAFNGFPIGLQPIEGRNGRKVRVWFFHVLLGTVTPGESYSWEPYFPAPDDTMGVVRMDDAVPVSPGTLDCLSHEVTPEVTVPGDAVTPSLAVVDTAGNTWVPNA